VVQEAEDTQVKLGQQSFFAISQLLVLVVCDQNVYSILSILTMRRNIYCNIYGRHNRDEPLPQINKNAFSQAHIGTIAKGKKNDSCC